MDQIGSPLKLHARYFMTDNMYNSLDNITGDTKITVARTNQSIWESCNRGKSPLCLGAFNKICQVLIPSNKPEHIFAIFLTLEWYLMYWTDSCVHLHVNHIDWHGDCIII